MSSRKLEFESSGKLTDFNKTFRFGAANLNTPSPRKETELRLTEFSATHEVGSEIEDVKNRAIKQIKIHDAGQTSIFKNKNQEIKSQNSSSSISSSLAKKHSKIY